MVIIIKSTECMDYIFIRDIPSLNSNNGLNKLHIFHLFVEHWSEKVGHRDKEEDNTR